MSIAANSRFVCRRLPVGVWGSAPSSVGGGGGAQRFNPVTQCGSIGGLDPTTATSSSSALDQQVRFRSNRSRRGLYNGKDIRAGNSLSFSMKANKRTFKPNVFKKRVYSETLDEMIRFHLTASTLRSIDKAGGLDEYLLKSKHVTEGEGSVAKQRILKKMKEHETNNEAANASSESITA